ncbi:MAG: hypothetical protein GEEBNDBF_00792 [bacterium]|nr:hypothetical protein [bacterium]
MTTTRQFLAPGLCLLTLGSFTPAATAQSGSTLESTIGDQQSVAITVYNDGLGLVRDVRTVAVPTGPFQLNWRDVASQINTQSVSLVNLSNPEGLSVLEQNYQYDLIDRSKLLSKYLGKRVQVQLWEESGGGRQIKNATLLAPDVVEIDGKIYPGIPGQLILPELPGGLISVPTLQWLAEGYQAGPQQVAMSYLTSGMSWQADYVAVVNEKDTALDLNGWTTITNNSGTSYNNATLKLIAGDVNRVQPDYAGAMPMAAMEMDMVRSKAAEQFEEKSFFEYHLYTLGRATTLRNNEQKQIALLDAAKVPATKKFVFEPGGDYWWWNPQDSQKVDIQVKMEFRNAKEQHLGMPLPKGIVRVYKADTDGTLQFIGEDRIDHTPKDETVRLLLGNAFDIVGERIVANRRKISTDIWEYDITVKLRNHKTEAAVVSVIDKVSYGDWSVTRHTGGDYKKQDASTLEFSVRCEPDVEKVLTYTIRREY